MRKRNNTQGFFKVTINGKKQPAIWGTSVIDVLASLRQGERNRATSIKVERLK